MAESSAQSAARETGWEYLGLDPTPAPALDVSIGAAIERFTGHRLGSSGTLAAARLITAAVRSVPVKRVGYAGLMLPVLEDLRIQTLPVCSPRLNTILSWAMAIPGSPRDRFFHINPRLWKC